VLEKIEMETGVVSVKIILLRKIKNKRNTTVSNAEMDLN
jgi:hypothetical protein